MRIFGLAGWSGSGKTTLMTALIPEFVARGITVSTIKHAHHAFDVDQPGKDSWRHREAGASEVMVVSERRWALMHELRGDARTRARRAGGADHPGRSAAGRGLQASPASEARDLPCRRSGSRHLHPDDPFIVAVACDEELPGLALPWLPLGDAAAIAAFILRYDGLGPMAQLSDDCFAFGGNLLSVDEALARIEARVVPVVEIEAVPLAEAAGRILAADLIAGVRPAAARQQRGRRLCRGLCRSARPIAKPMLPVGGRAAAGHPLDRADPARRGGPHLYRRADAEGADTVLMQEDCVAAAGRVRLKPGISMGANRRHAGEDVAKGALALAAGRRLGPADLGLAAALGNDRLPVFRRLRVALLSTGDEVREPGTALPPGAIYDANRFMLRALLEGLGCVVTDLGILPDREAALRRRARRCQHRARSDRHLGRGVDRRGGSRQGRDRAPRRAPFLAAGDQAGPAGGARPGRRACR